MASLRCRILHRAQFASLSSSYPDAVGRDDEISGKDVSGWCLDACLSNCQLRAEGDAGDDASIALADAYVKGIRNFDAVKAYEGMRMNAFSTPYLAKDTVPERAAAPSLPI